VSPHVNVIRARTPWEGTNGAPEISAKGEAPRKTIAYICVKGEHRFELVFALAAEVPGGWDCPRCGQPARLEGAPEGTEGMPDLPGLASGAGRHERAGSDVTPMGQLRKRRSKKQGDALLAERMAEVRAGGWSR
jgi:hypothetical protein